MTEKLSNKVTWLAASLALAAVQKLLHAPGCRLPEPNCFFDLLNDPIELCIAKCRSKTRKGFFFRDLARHRCSTGLYTFEELALSATSIFVVGAGSELHTGERHPR